MWFISNIVTWLNSISDYFWDAYQEVRGWVWPLELLGPPLYYLYRGFSFLAIFFGYFDDWAMDVADKLVGIVDLSQIQSYFGYYFEAALNAWDWVSNASWNIWELIDAWWSSVQYTVRGWIDEALYITSTQIEAVRITLTQIEAAWADFKGRIPSIDEVIAWWSDWGGNVAMAIATWWAGTLLEVQGLIDSAFIERQSWWAGWSDFRDQVALFFSDPLEFLLAKFTDWFLGPEV